ncbi:MAG TPA: DUF4386 domain-containing protein [Candidatus Saccharimonadales bacterium]|nr:DUF4386 domain-containing protein [Candidatus Saccharimonadales bacterium]
MQNKTVARTVGALFITGTVAGILSVAVTGSILNSQDYLAKIADNEGRVVMGALFVLIMAFSLAMIPVILFPIFKKYNEALALGAVLFRGALETFMYITIVIGWILLIALSHQEGIATDTSLQATGTLLQTAGTWSAHILAIVFSLGALMVYCLFYISKLIPVWLSVWGIAGAILYLATSLLVMFGLTDFGMLMAPLALQEMVLAVWLLTKGFRSGGEVSATRPKP